MPTLYPRRDTQHVWTALANTPVMLLNGPRQSGKTTLARDLLGTDRTFRSLNGESTLAPAVADPTGFIRNTQRLTIGEVQRAPALLRAIKNAVDGHRRAGRFLLTGSTNVLSLPRAAGSLASRMAVIDLLPLAQAETAQTQSASLDAILAGDPPPSGKPTVGKALERIVLTGGYPVMLRRRNPTRRANWARNYLRAIVQRGVSDVASVKKPGLMPRLPRVLAQHSGQLVNYAQIGGQLGLDARTARKYLDVFQQLFLVRSIDPWSASRPTRLIKTPGLHFLGSGLLAVLLGVTKANLADRRKSFGTILESFVLAEIDKLVGWAGGECQLLHYCDKDQNEVDLVIEHTSGETASVAVKAAATISAADFRGLRKLTGACGSRFRCGLVPHDGNSTLPFGAHLYAAPVSSLWDASTA